MQTRPKHTVLCGFTADQLLDPFIIFGMVDINRYLIMYSYKFLFRLIIKQYLFKLVQRQITH